MTPKPRLCPTCSPQAARASCGSLSQHWVLSVLWGLAGAVALGLVCVSLVTWDGYVFSFATLPRACRLRGGSAQVFSQFSTQ